MATEVKMPALGESITEGTITRWLKQQGDRVEVDEPLLEVSTDKVDTEVPSPVAGVLSEIQADEDATVQVGAVLAVIDEGGEAGADGGAQAGDQAEETDTDTETGGGEARGGDDQDAGDQADEDDAAARAKGEEEAAEAQTTSGAQAATPDEREDVAEAGSDQDTGASADGGAEAEAGGGDGDGDGGGPPKPDRPMQAKASGGGKTTPVTLPALGESITEGTITRWLKQEGDRVEADEPLFEVSTDKVDTEVPSPISGVLQQIKVQQDETVQVGGEVAVLAEEGAAGAEADGQGGDGQAAAPAEEADTGERETPPGRPMQAKPPEGGDGKRAEQARGGEEGGRAPYTGPVSPLVRKLAREHDIDLDQVKGSGTGGRIVRADVLAYIDSREAGDGKAAPEAEPAAKPEAEPSPKRPEAPKRPMQFGKPATPSERPVSAGNVPLPTGLRVEVVKASRTRRITAERMVDSLQVSAQLTTAVEIDMTKVMRLRERAKDAFKQREGISLSPLPFCLMAVIAATREHPLANAALDADFNLHLYKDVNLGIAVDTPKGLFVPVIRNADTLNLTGLARAVADVAKRTREGKIGPDELSGSTITVTNTGSVGAVIDTPIINQPNAVIVATPAIVRRPVVIDHPDLGETIAVRHMMNGVVTYDHRILDGADAARFATRIKQVLEAADFAGELGLDG